MDTFTQWYILGALAGLNIVLTVLLSQEIRRSKRWKKFAQDSVWREAQMSGCDHNFMWKHGAKVRECRKCKKMEAVFPNEAVIPL